jgi:hypothetical protein
MYSPQQQKGTGDFDEEVINEPSENEVIHIMHKEARLVHRNAIDQFKDMFEDAAVEALMGVSMEKILECYYASAKDLLMRGVVSL